MREQESRTRAGSSHKQTSTSGQTTRYHPCTLTRYTCKWILTSDNRRDRDPSEERRKRPRALDHLAYISPETACVRTWARTIRDSITCGRRGARVKCQWSRGPGATRAGRFVVPPRHARLYQNRNQDSRNETRHAYSWFDSWIRPYIFVPKWIEMNSDVCLPSEENIFVRTVMMNFDVVHHMRSTNGISSAA